MNAIKARNKRFEEQANKPSTPKGSEKKIAAKKEQPSSISRSTKLVVAGFLTLILGSIFIEVFRLFLAK